MSSEQQPNLPETTIESLFIPEIWTKIVSHLSSKDLLNLRECSHAAERAIASADRLIEGSSDGKERSEIAITLKSREFTASFGATKFSIKAKRRPLPPPKPEKKGFIRSMKRLIIGVDNREPTPRWDLDKAEILELVKMRSRLFKRVTVKTVSIDVNDFVPFAWIANLLSDCIFSQLSVTIWGAVNEDVTDFLRKHCEKVIKLDMNRLSDAKLALSFNPMEILSIKHDLRMSNVELLELIAKHHVGMKLPVIVATAKGITCIIKAMLSWEGGQVVDLHVRTKALLEFMDKEPDESGVKLKLYPVPELPVIRHYDVPYNERMNIRFSTDVYAKRPKEIQPISFELYALHSYCDADVLLQEEYDDSILNMFIQKRKL